jgi:hypothetical protein
MTVWILDERICGLVKSLSFLPVRFHV